MLVWLHHVVQKSFGSLDSLASRGNTPWIQGYDYTPDQALGRSCCKQQLVAHHNWDCHRFLQYDASWVLLDFLSCEARAEDAAAFHRYLDHPGPTMDPKQCARFNCIDVWLFCMIDDFARVVNGLHHQEC